MNGANLNGARLIKADLTGANLIEAYLNGADLTTAYMSEADLTGVALDYAVLVRTNFANATLDGCSVYGTSVWNANLNGARQRNLLITAVSEPEITVDDLRLAQFIHLLLNNPEIRDVIDTLTSKVVLILGRFSEERIAVLDMLGDALREHDYVPVLFDFSGPRAVVSPRR